MKNLEKLNVKIINNSIYENPSYSTELSSGADMRANISESMVIKPSEIVLVPTGIHIELVSGYEAQIRSRSGMTLKHGIVVANGVGTIDADYRGEIKIILQNISQVPYTLNPGERIAQMVICPYIRANFINSEVLKSSERGDGGFGHTGK